MRILLAGMMALLLLRAPETMAAAEAACALFVRSVMPGLFPYLTLSQMLVSRCGRDMQPGLLMLLGWCGGSPTGARLLAMQGSRPHREQKALAVSCATMSPMFLLGTIGSWLNSRIAGAIVLLSGLTGGRGLHPLKKCQKQQCPLSPSHARWRTAPEPCSLSAVR
mgnify:CR=1 FL=1